MAFLAVAQTFELEFANPEDEIANDAFQFSDSCYVLLSQAGNFSTSDYPLINIIILNNYGEVLNSLKIEIEIDFQLYSAQEMMFITNDTIIIAGTGINRTNNQYEQYFAWITNEIEFLRDTTIDTEYGSDVCWDYIINKKNNIVAVGYESANGAPINMIIREFSISGQLLKRESINWPSNIATSIVEFPEENVYHITTLFGERDDCILVLDEDNQQIVDSIIIPGIIDPLKALKSPDNEYYVVAGKAFDATEMMFKTSFLTSNKDLELSDLHLYGIPDTNYYYHKNCVDFVSDSIIYLAATHNFTQSPPYLYPERCWIFMNKLKTDGTIIWQRFYKGELNYMPYKVLTTSDGGALILSHKYDWNSPYPNQRDIHILKIDSTGWYEGLPPVGTDEYSGMKQILVYPNPALDVVHFEPGLYNDLELQIFDQAGNQVLTKPLHSHQTVDVSDFETGVYIYVIQNKNGFLEKGKLVKE
jgi:hypothetical protein